jgi:hypothetical protein
MSAAVDAALAEIQAEVERIREWWSAGEGVIANLDTELAEKVRAAVDARVADLEAAERGLAVLNGAKPPPVRDAPPTSGGGSAPAPASSTRKRRSPAKRKKPAGVDDAAAEKKRQERKAATVEGQEDDDLLTPAERVLSYVREHPGCSQREIMKGLGMTQGTASRITIKLTRSGKIRADESGKAKAYFAKEAPALPADESGAKSGEEKKIVDCLIEAGTPLPASEISVRTGIQSHRVPSMCAALHRRRVIAHVPPKHGGLPSRWQSITHPRTMADRA